MTTTTRSIMNDVYCLYLWLIWVILSIYHYHYDCLAGIAIPSIISLELISWSLIGVVAFTSSVTRDSVRGTCGFFCSTTFLLIVSTPQNLIFRKAYMSLQSIEGQLHILLRYESLYMTPLYIIYINLSLVYCKCLWNSFN